MIFTASLGFAIFEGGKLRLYRAISRFVYPVAPPEVEYELTKIGLSLGAAFCGVWVWAAENLNEVERARRKFERARGTE